MIFPISVVEIFQIQKLQFLIQKIQLKEIYCHHHCICIKKETMIDTLLVRKIHLGPSHDFVKLKNGECNEFKK